MGHAYNDDSTDYDEKMRGFAKHILTSLGKGFTDENIKNLIDELIFNDCTVS